MKIAVCMKWVPVVARMKFDAETKRIIREGVPSEVNPYDVLSVQRAVELKESHGAEVTVYTMGPPQARDGLVRGLAAGADHAVHLMDAAFAGSDTLATSRALALALGKEQYDLIFFADLDVNLSPDGPDRSRPPALLEPSAWMRTARDPLWPSRAEPNRRRVFTACGGV